MTNETLFAGRPVPVQYDDGHTDDVRVHQLKLGQYEKAFALLDDEIGLTALACGKNRDWLCRDEPGKVVTPESYERLWTAVQEVNATGFFAWSTRRAQIAARKQTEMISALATLPPETIKLAVEKGMTMNGTMASAAGTLASSSRS